MSIDEEFAQFCRQYHGKENLDWCPPPPPPSQQPPPVVDDDLGVFVRQEAIRSRWMTLVNHPEEFVHMKTRTQRYFLHRPIRTELEDLFWSIPVLPYESLREGVVAKDMRVQYKDPALLVRYEQEVETTRTQHPSLRVQETIFPIRNPAIVAYRRIQIGVQGKELRIQTRRTTRAFSYCFVVYVRWRLRPDAAFTETHVKLFNSGQIDVPGLLTHEALTHLRNLLWRCLFAPYAHRYPERPRCWFCPITSPNLMWNATVSFGGHIHIAALRDRLTEVAIVYHDDYRQQTSVRCKYVWDVVAGAVGKLADEDGMMSWHGKFDGRKYLTITCCTYWTGSVVFSGACDEHILHHVAQFHLRFLLDHLSEFHDVTNPSIYVRKPNGGFYENKWPYVFDMDGGAAPPTADWPTSSEWVPAKTVNVVTDKVWWRYVIGCR